MCLVVAICPDLKICLAVNSELIILERACLC